MQRWNRKWKHLTTEGMRSVRRTEFESTTRFYIYDKGENDRRALFDRRLISLQKALELVSAWSYALEREQEEPCYTRHEVRVFDAASQLTQLASIANIMEGDYVCWFATEEDQPERHLHQFVMSKWSLFHPLPVSLWPTNPAQPPFAVMSGWGLISPVEINGLKPFYPQFPRYRTLILAGEFMKLGGWGPLKMHAGRLEEKRTRRQRGHDNAIPRLRLLSEEPHAAQEGET